MRGRATSFTVALSAADSRTLRHWQQAVTMPMGQARRGRMILLLAEGMPIVRIAEMVAVSRRHVYKWIKRYLAQGITGLKDQPKGNYKHTVA